MQVAFLGLGAIGTPMAGHVARAFPPLVVWNRTAAKASAFAEARGARAAVTPAEAARGADVVITCLPTSVEVAALLDGADGLLQGLAAGAVLVDCTSGDPAASRAIAARLADHGVAFLDAPVSGGTTGAVAATLTVMVGGAADTLDRVRPVLASFGRTIVPCGPVGAGHAVKAVNNALLAVHVWSTGEGLAALAKAGVAPAVALDVINASSGRSNASQHLFPERVLTGAYPRTFRLALLDKDTRIAAQVAREGRVASPLLQLASELLAGARATLGDAADHEEMVRVIEAQAGVALRAEPTQ
jgi:3-hydroxyisobutyrate dehydrogenase